MIKYILAFIYIVVGWNMSFSQGYNIQVELTHYESDTLMLGYYYWDKQFIRDTAYLEDGHFTFSGEDTLEAGIYLIITKPDNKFMQLVISKDDQELSIKTDALNMTENLEIEGSLEFQMFQDYMIYLGEARERSTVINERFKDDAKKKKDELTVLDHDVMGYQDSIQSNYPQSMLAFIINANSDVKIPEFEGEDIDLRDLQYRYYVKHYFDAFDFSDNRWLYSAFLHSKIDNYLKNVIVKIPDTINKSLDLIFQKLESNVEARKRVLVHYLNAYAKSEFVGLDAVYVHLVENYYADGKAPWVEEKQLSKMIDDAKNLKPILIGKQAPDITVKKRDGSSVHLYDLDYEYTILMFWAPDCGHCKKTIPELVDIYPQIKERGAELIAICTKLIDKEKTCWEYIDEHELNGLWINTSDKYLRSRFKQLYNVVSTPKIFILDKKKKIVSKKIGIKQLIEVLDKLKSIEKEEGTK